MMTSTNAVLDTMWNGMDSNGFSGWITFNLLDEWPGHQRGNKFQRDPWWKKSFFYRQTEIHCMTIAYICIYILYFIYLYVCIHLCMYHYIYTYIHRYDVKWCQTCMSYALELNKDIASQFLCISDKHISATWTFEVYPNHEWYTVS